MVGHLEGTIESCSRSDCGKKKPRCPVCQTYFVTNMYDLCTGCLLDPSVTCDNCKQEKTKLFRTELDELWCFDCLDFYQEKGPALSFNKQIINLSKEAKDKFYSQYIPPHTSKRKCKSCKETYIGSISIDTKICISCLRLMSKDLCTSCYKTIDPDIGTDKEGKCMECSSNVISKNYGYPDPDYETGLLSTAFPTHKMFKDVDGICTNCSDNIVVINKQLCKNCLDLIKDLNKKFLDSLQDDIK